MTNSERAIHPNLAAERLGISVDCVYERIRRGELAARKEGGRWLVLLDAATDVPAIELPPSEHPVVTAPSEPPAVVTAQPTESQSARAEELDEIRAQLAALEAEIRALSSVVQRTQLGPVPVVTSPRELRPARLAFVRQRPRIVLLLGIIALVLGGSLIQASSAQRADDLTVAFVFACGAVTGAIVAWLALDKREPATPRNRRDPGKVRRPLVRKAGDGDMRRRVP
ncbi:MAG TPA: helix-turn-helix domain-containing protein [Thermomicrobiales bacterium]|nr:helix-turn-helix domain-containing protein [Thermomicrobiales bacterium]